MKKLILFFILGSQVWPVFSQQAVEFDRFAAPNATQGVAVDKDYLYVISNSRIVKYTKATHEQVDSWEGPLKHMNSGAVIKGKLYCVNSNYPLSPPASSIEIFDPNTLEHIANHSLGIYAGSLTWLDWHEGYWYAMFAQYENEAKELGKDAYFSQIVQFDSLWRRTAGWILPKDLIDKNRPLSISGGGFAPDGNIYLSPHHDLELYIIRLPKMGYEVEWVQTIASPTQGQAFAWDKSAPWKLYGIHRQNREVIGVEIVR